MCVSKSLVDGHVNFNLVRGHITLLLLYNDRHEWIKTIVHHYMAVYSNPTHRQLTVLTSMAKTLSLFKHQNSTYTNMFSDFVTSINSEN